MVAGESLWSISEDYYGTGYVWKDLAQANNLTDYSLEVGQKLNLPILDSADETTQDDTYTVVKGDTLWEIAVNSYGDGYKWVEIAKANNLKNPNLIHTGNVLTLPR